MIVQILAFFVLVLVLVSLFRFAMGLRTAKLAREEARQSEEGRGRRVIAEIPLAEHELVFFLEDEAGFYWAGREVRKSDLVGARLLLNGGVMGACVRNGAALPPPPAPEEYEGRERWEVLLHLRTGGDERVPCGTLREGVSREIASQVFEAVREALGKASASERIGATG